MRNRARVWSIVVSVFGLVAALVFTFLFPAVKGLGTRVRLPVFHGSLTWANLVLFAVLGIVGIVAFFTTGERGQRTYRWVDALRITAVVLWLGGTVLGLIAARLSWDFSASQTSPWQLLLAEPRMQLQFVVSLVGVAALALPLVLGQGRLRSLIAGLFGVATLVGLYFAMTAGTGLHPDSPVMNSDELRIKLTFYLMFAGQLVLSAGLTAFVRSCYRQRNQRFGTHVAPLR
ncbi:MAG: hypothetical protein LBS17_03805 [Actinomycetes bacterium]|nr:hypothetical protein [Actinomycetes bacterium]